MYTLPADLHVIWLKRILIIFVKAMKNLQILGKLLKMKARQRCAEENHSS